MVEATAHAPVLRKRDRTRQALIEASLRLFAEKGIEGTSVLDITEALGVSNGSFYYHFGGKEHLLEVVGHAIIIDLNEVIGSREGSDPACILARGPMIVLRYMDQNPHLHAIFVRVIEDIEGRHEDLSDRLEAYLKWGVEIGRFIIDDLGVATRFCRDLVGSAARLRYQGEEDPHLGPTTAKLTLQMLGLSPAEAAAIVVQEQALIETSSKDALQLPQLGGQGRSKGAAPTVPAKSGERKSKGG